MNPMQTMKSIVWVSLVSSWRRWLSIPSPLALVFALQSSVVRDFRFRISDFGFPARPVTLALSLSLAGGLSLAGVLSLAGGLVVAAQEPDASAQTNETMPTEAITRLRDLAQAADQAQPEDMAPPDDLSSTNGPSPTNGPAPVGEHADGVSRSDNASRSAGTNRFQSSSRSQNDDRRSRRRSLKSKSDQSGGFGSANDSSRGSDRASTNAAAGASNGPVVLDYAAFKVIVDRNIFDPNRVPHRSGAPSVRPKPKNVDSLTLVGTMSYEKGTFAFFDGTSSDYKKALKLTDAIAGYRVTNIAPNSVKLASGTNELELSVGAQLRREEDGPWLLASQAGTYAATPASTSTNAAANPTTTGSDATSGGADDDRLKKLMQRREKE